MYRHTSQHTPSTLYDIFPILKRLPSFSSKLDVQQDDASLLGGDPEKRQIFSYGTSPSSSCPPTPGAKYLITKTDNDKKPLAAVVVTEVTLTPSEDEINPFDRYQEVVAQQQQTIVVEGAGVSADLIEEVVEARFPMTVFVSARRGYRKVQGKYLWDRFPLICAIVLLVQVIAMSKLIAVFNSYYETKPLATMMASNAILNALADTMAQTVTAIREKSLRRQKNAETRLEGGNDAIALQIHEIDRKIPDSFAPGELIPKSSDLPPPFDFQRLSRFIVWGVVMAPIQFNWFKVLSKTFPVKDGAGSIVPALKRVGCDQLLFAPTGLAAFFTYMTIAEGGGKEGLKRKFENIYIPALRSNYLIWPAVQLINFRVMPIQFQLPFVSTVGIFWTTYLSLTNSAAEATED